MRGISLFLIALAAFAADEPLKPKPAKEQYTKREIEYPVDFAMDITMQLVRQNPMGAMQTRLDLEN